MAQQALTIVYLKLSGRMRKAEVDVEPPQTAHGYSYLPRFFPYTLPIR